MRSTFLVGSAGSRVSRRIGLALLLGAACLPVASAAADFLLSPSAQLLEVDAQSCQLECGKTLSGCEHERSKGRHCPREFQECKDNCASTRRVASSRIKPKTQLCAQRCETSAALCVQSNPRNPEPCEAGRKQCEDRC